jgi:short-subunit dehydrogenase
MKLQHARILLTGATGGIGQHLVDGLLKRGARLCLLDRSESGLLALRGRLGDAAAQVCAVTGDVTRAEDRQRCVQTMLERFGGIDILINLAGTTAFARFEEQTPESIQALMQVNTAAPMLMSHAVLPHMLAQQRGQIVNVGSMFGSIAFPCFASYSASKYALRGFSQALRRELAGTGVGVTYVAPRAVRTPLNTPAVYAVAQKIKMTFDDPATVAEAIIQAVAADKKEKYIGFPESLFARINAILPGLVDNSLNKQSPVMRDYARKRADG